MEQTAHWLKQVTTSWVLCTCVWKGSIVGRQTAPQTEKALLRNWIKGRHTYTHAHMCCSITTYSYKRRCQSHGFVSCWQQSKVYEASNAVSGRCRCRLLSTGPNHVELAYNNFLFSVVPLLGLSYVNQYFRFFSSKLYQLDVVEYKGEGLKNPVLYIYVY